MHDLTELEVDPDGQPPLPLEAAKAYAKTVMTWARHPLPAGIECHLDQAYGQDRLQRFDVYAPVGARRAPVLVFWHGGGWTNGYRDYVRFMAPHVVSRGLVLVAPSYRLAPTHRLPAAYDDAQTLLACVLLQCDQWGGDASQVVLSGHSAGAHLATLVSLRQADRLARGVRADSVRACLPVSGIMDLQHPCPTPGSLEDRVYTMVLENPLLDAVMSPVCWTSRQSITYALTLGARDSERVVRSNHRLRALLESQGTPVQWHELPDTDHFGSHTRLHDSTDPWYRMLERVL